MTAGEIIVDGVAVGYFGESWTVRGVTTGCLLRAGMLGNVSSEEIADIVHVLESDPDAVVNDVVDGVVGA